MNVDNVVNHMKIADKLRNSDGSKKSGDQKKEMVMNLVKAAIEKEIPDVMIVEGIMMMVDATIDGIVEIAKKNINLKQFVKTCGCL